MQHFSFNKIYYENGHEIYFNYTCRSVWSRLFNRNNVITHDLSQKSLLSIEADLFPIKLLNDNLIEYQFHINKLLSICHKNGA